MPEEEITPTGIEAIVVTSPEIMEATKWQKIPSLGVNESFHVSSVATEFLLEGWPNILPPERCDS